MNFDFHAPNDSEKELLKQSDEGLLRVEVPHWAAQVQIYDHRLQPVQLVGAIRSLGQNTNVSETALLKGTYQVEVTLDGKTESEWIPVRANRVTQTSEPESWQNLEMTASAPLLKTATKRESHTNPAQDWSRQITWHNSPGGDSRLFLFVRTLQPEKYQNFYEGLMLLDAEGKLVTDLSEGVEIDKANGWLAFTADLPSGGYILRRGRRGVRVRHHPIYLCQNQETQLFLISEKYPTPRTLTLNMAQRGRGFEAEDETTLAAEAVFSSLNYGTSHRQIAMSEKMERLLEEKFENAWLGIVAAYALFLARKEATNISMAGKTDFNDQQEIDRLFRKVLNFLQNKIGEHPDVLALSLQENEPPVKPFAFPPLLWLGVKRVHRHSTRFAETIPFGSLTDCLLDNLLSDSPWTAWRKLDRLPDFGETSETIFTDQKKSLLKLKPTAPAKPLLPIIPLNAPAKAPVFSMPGNVHEADEQTIFLDSLLKQFVVELTEDDEISRLPEQVNFDSSQKLNSLLVVVNPAEISETSGLPLSRIEFCAADLQKINYQSFTFGEEIKPETAIIAQTAIQNISRNSRQKTIESAELTVSAAECADKIRVEAEQLLFHREKANEQINFRVEDSAKRLFRVAEKLLTSADFAVLTHPKRGIFSPNVAFLNLLLLPPGETKLDNPKSVEKTREKNRRVWEKALRKSPLGLSSIIVQTGEATFTGELRRTAINDPARNELWAYLNFFRHPHAIPPAQEILQKVNDLSSNLSLYATLFSYGSKERKDEYLHELSKLIEELERLSENLIFKERIRMENNVIEIENDVPTGDGDLTMPDGTLFGVEFWGITRHELIAGAAMAFLSNRAKTEVERILAPINKISLEDVAGWADRLRGNIPNADDETRRFLADNRNRSRGTWHYVNIPHAASGYSREDYPEFTRDDDVVQMIRHCVLVLKGESDRFSELNALRWLSHLVGDVHQPIHVGCGYLDESSDPARLVFDPEFVAENNLEHDRGGNRIKLPIGASLHSYWDSRLLPAEEEDEPQADEPTDGGESNFDEADADVSPELKKRFIQKLIDRIKSNALAATDADAAEADEPANDLDGLPPEDWATVWATDSMRYARQAYQSLRIVENLADGNFKVEWEGKEAYQARCRPIAQRQADAAAENLAALLNAIWSED